MQNASRRAPARAIIPRLPAQQALSLRRHRPDYWMIVLVVTLLGVGLVVLFSISPALSATQHAGDNYFVMKQLLAIGLGLAVLIVTAQLPAGSWRTIAVPLLAIAGAATLLAVIMPVNPNYPAHRWVRLGSLSFQSVELLKFALLVWLAGLLHDRIRSGEIANLKDTLRPIAIVLAVVGLVVVGIQSDLGSMGVIVAMVAAMLFVAGVPLKRLMLIAGIVAMGLVLSISAIPYRRERLFAFLHPSSSNCQGSGYQACQALIAVGSGGMFGLGLGSSVQAYGYLPEASNDSIFAIYAEKFGFVGCVVLLALFGALLARLRTTAERSSDDYNRLLVVGIVGWLGVQSAINIGAMVGLLPLKGITLPFVSYGGTSVIFMMAAIGLAFQASRYTVVGARTQFVTAGGRHDNSPDGRRLGGAYRAHPDSRERT